MARHKRHRAGKLEPGTDVERQVLEELRRLETASIKDLKEHWNVLTGRNPPRFAKRSLLTQLIAWELQAQAFGGLEPAAQRYLLSIGKANAASDAMEQPRTSTPALRPGVKLIRMWRGVTHHVTVIERGFVWQDRTYKSLSMIAREITGTSWSGPAFFGLRKVKISADKVGDALVRAAAHG
jgi:Protein of unknown function (DUF2924)